MAELNPSPISVTETKVSNPLIRPLDLIRCLKYGCTWMVLAIIFGIMAGYIGDHSDPIRPGEVAALIISAVGCLVTGIVIVSNGGYFTPDLD